MCCVQVAARIEQTFGAGGAAAATRAAEELQEAIRSASLQPPPSLVDAGPIVLQALLVRVMGVESYLLYNAALRSHMCRRHVVTGADNEQEGQSSSLGNLACFDGKLYFSERLHDANAVARVQPLSHEVRNDQGFASLEA